MNHKEITAQIEIVISSLYNIRLPAQELQATTAIMREAIHLKDICKKLKEENENEGNDQPK